MDRTMARKRSIEVEEESVAVEHTSEDSHELQTTEKAYESWHAWFRKTYARYWYIVGCIFVDLLVSLEVARISPKEYSVGFSVFLFLVLALIEMFLYARVWGRPKWL